MSIATSLQASVGKIRELQSRNNGDLETYLGTVLHDMECDIARVHGLEQVAPINMELLNDFQNKGGIHEHNHS